MTISKIKQFNINEYCSWMLSQCSPHNCIITAGIEGEIDISHFKNAVKSASINQPQLRYTISLDICGFIPTDRSIDINEIHLDTDWRKIAENELSKPFLHNDSLARITVLKTKTMQYIILCFHHIIGDGNSGINFLSKILYYYNDPKYIEKIHTDKENEILLPTPKPQTLSTDQVFSETVKTKISGIHIKNDLIPAIENKTKALGCSLNSYLSLMILEAASEVFNTNEFDVAMSVDLRKRNVNQSFQNLKFLTSWIDFKWKANDSAKSIQSKIRSGFHEKQHLKNLISLNEVINQRKNHSDFINAFSSKNPSICISNCGKINIPTNESVALKLIELHLSVNCQAYLGARNSFTIPFSQLNQNGIFINVNYVDTLVCEKEIKIFLSFLEQKLIC